MLSTESTDASEKYIVKLKLDHVVPVGRQHRQIWRLVAETEDVGPRVPHQPPFVLVATCC